MGLAALKALYQLAKMIKEAKDNVEFIAERVHITESIEHVISIQLGHLGETTKMDANMEKILDGVKTRLVKLQRASRRMKLKYQPLLKILEGLGGNSSLVKDMTSKLSKALQSAVMALGSLSVMMRKRNDREESRAQRAFSANSSHAADAEEVLRLQCNEIAHVHSALDSLDTLVASLRSQDDALVGAMHDDEKGSQEKHKMSYHLLPKYTPTKTTTKTEPDAKSGGGLPITTSMETKTETEGEGTALTLTPSLDELRHTGANLLLDQAFCVEDQDLVDDHKLQHALGRAYTPSCLAFLKRQLGETLLDDDGKPNLSAAKVITRQRMESLLLVDGRGNTGLEIAVMCSAALVALDRQLDEAAVLLPEVPKPLSHTRHILDTIMRPLVAQALSVGLLLQLEKLQEASVDDPYEIAAREGETDDKSIEDSLVLLETFAKDFAEAHEFNLAPDASLLVSVAIDAGDAKAGLGPSTRRRLELLMAILSICNVESDKDHLESIESDLRAEVSLLSAATTLVGQSMLVRDLDVGVGLASKIHELYHDMTAQDAYRRHGRDSASYGAKRPQIQTSGAEGDGPNAQRPALAPSPSPEATTAIATARRRSVFGSK